MSGGATGYDVDDGQIVLNEGRNRVVLTVSNTGDRAVQVGSHYHFFEANSALSFDRARAWGKHLDIGSGLAVRFEPGDTRTVTLVDYGGRRRLRGFAGIAEAALDLGPTELADLDDADAAARCLDYATTQGFLHTPVADDDLPTPTPATLTRRAYAEIYGPTVGDRIHLADTNLVLEIERDVNSDSHGDEAVYGGGKAIRDGMAQHPVMTNADGALDLVITNAIVVDALQGVLKADVGIREGRIVGIGKAGNPELQEGVSPELVIGAGTEVVSGEHSILTAGGIDTHIHYIAPQQVDEALAAGITTMVGGGTGPTEGTKGTTCTPGPHNIHLMLQALDGLGVNAGVLGKGNASAPGPLVEQIRAGAAGLKIHEDWGTTPAAIRTCLEVADDYDVQVAIHTDTLNESGFYESTREAIGDHTIHTFHSEGAGGGHAPDILRVTGESSVLPASTNPTLPYTINSVDELLDMVMVCHHLSHDIPEDVSFADSRVRAETIAAETVLHDEGVISIFSSDSQAMGRLGENWTRLFQTAHHCKAHRGPLPEDEERSGGRNDNERILRYVAKMTINPARAAGIAGYVGSIEPGLFADLVVWPVGSVGAKPKVVLRQGLVACAPMGDPNASLPTPQPVWYRPMFAEFGAARAATRITFMSRAAIEAGVPERLGLTSTVLPVENCRDIGKKDMVRNDRLPEITVDPETYRVTIDGTVATIPPAESLPLTQLFYLA